MKVLCKKDFKKNKSEFKSGMLYKINIYSDHLVLVSVGNSKDSEVFFIPDIWVGEEKSDFNEHFYSIEETKNILRINLIDKILK